MRKKIVAGNWKMNNDLNKSLALISDLLKKVPQTNAEVMIAPTFVNLIPAVEAVKGSHIEVIAQNMHFAENGAYTGEISAEMLGSIGVKTTILGHSERRAYFNETDESLAKKVNTALKHNMRVVFCIGEELADRKANKHFDVVVAKSKMVCSTCLLRLGNILYWLTNLYGLLVQAKPLLLTKHKKFITLFVKLLLTNTAKGLLIKYLSCMEVV